MFDLQPNLDGHHVCLRPLVEADYDALFEVASDPELWALHPAKDRWQEPVFRQLFETALTSGGAMTAMEKQSGRIIGSSRYNLPDPASGRAEIGWSYLSRSHWGGFWNREIKSLLLTHAFRFVDNVYFRIGESNLRSRHATAKLGVVLTQETETLQMADGSHVVHVFYELSRTEFERRIPSPD